MSRTYASHILERRVFSDAVSEVWHARHLNRSTQRATVRIIAADRTTLLAPAIEPYLADARAAAGLIHRNIVRAYSIGDRAQPYVLGRHTPGVPWSEHVRHGIGAAAAIELLGPVASALDVAGEAGTPHGAVHPGTIWVEGVGALSTPRALLTGFGLHHLLSVVAARGGDGRSLADFLYVAPELLRGAAPSNRSDQYALAAAFHHALTGRPIFERERLSALFGAHLFGHPPYVVMPDADMAVELSHILARGLAKVPDDRYETCQELVSELARWHRTVTGARSTGLARLLRAAPGRPPTPLPVQLGTPRRRTPPWARLAVVAATIVVVLTTVWLARTPSGVDGTQAAARIAPPDPIPAQTQPAGRDDDTAVAWETRLASRPTALHVTADGLVAVTPAGAVVIDAATGGVRADLSGAARPGAVVTGGRLVTPQAGGLRAVTVADGSVAWRAAVDTTSPTVAGGTVYAVSDGDIPRLVATDAASGERLWAFPQDEVAFHADATVAARDDFVYLADDAALYGILPEGAMAGADTPLITASEAASEPLCLWRHEVDEEMWTSSLRATADGVVVANRSGSLCLRRHSDGQPLWCVPVPGADRDEPAIHVMQDHVVVVTRTAVTAVDARTGAQAWTHEGAWRRSTTGGRRLVLVEEDGGVVSVSLVTGTLVRHADANVARPSALAVDGDSLYVGRGDGTVSAVTLRMPLR